MRILAAALTLSACTVQAADAPPAPAKAPAQKLRHLPDYDTMPPLEARGDSSGGFKVHDFARPQPKAVTVAEQPSQPAPSDALRLFDGTAASVKANWNNTRWPVKDGVLGQGGGDLGTKRAFGDCQLHVEWRALDKNHADMCNSGVLLMNGRYEVQIVDSAPTDGNLIPADAGAGAIYGWMPPLVNPMQPAGKWNSYDIIFRRPRFDDKGQCVKFARLTVLFNGALVQDNVQVPAIIHWLSHHPVTKHADKLPFALQNHGGGVEFRNVWVRELE